MTQIRVFEVVGISAFLFLGGKALADSSNNLLLNPGAEDRTNNWDCTFSTISSSRNLLPHSGNKFFTIDYAGYCTQIVNIADYITSVDFETAEVKAGLWVASPYEECLSRHTFTVSLSYFDESGNQLSDIEINPDMPGATHIWKKVELTDTVPYGTRSVRYFVEVHERCLNDSFAFDDAFLSIEPAQGSSAINLEAPQDPITANPQDNVTIQWSTTGAVDSDRIIISMKRDAVDAWETTPDDQNWYRFTDYGASNINDGYEIVTIPTGLIEASDWRFYVGLNNESEIWDSSSTFNYRDLINPHPEMQCDLNGNGVFDRRDLQIYRSSCLQ